MNHTEDQQNLMQGKKRTEFSQKMRDVSEEQTQMQSKQRLANDSLNMQTSDERQLFCVKRKVPHYTEKYLNKSENYGLFQSKQRHCHNQMESHDLPLSSPVVQRAQQVR